MNRQKIAQELVAVARELTSAKKGTGVRDIDDAMHMVGRNMKATEECRRNTTDSLVHASMSGDEQDFARMEMYLSDAEHHLTNLLDDAGRARKFVRDAMKAVKAQR